jgi:hypothetical protein
LPWHAKLLLPSSPLTTVPPLGQLASCSGARGVVWTLKPLTPEGPVGPAGPAAPAVAQLRTLLPVMVVTAVVVQGVAPVTLVVVRVMSAPARMLPWNVEVVSVTACLTHHVALQGLPPTTVKLVAVRAPVPPVPISKRQGPEPVSVRVPVNVAAAGKQ